MDGELAPPGFESFRSPQVTRVLLRHCITDNPFRYGGQQVGIGHARELAFWTSVLAPLGVPLELVAYQSCGASAEQAIDHQHEVDA